jgi:uncharacterized protein involved in exopolysaccharide biosynthesis
MRKPNIEIKRVNLAKAELQLVAYKAQLDTLNAKVKEVTEKYTAKFSQVETLQNEITALVKAEDSTTVVG